MIKSRRTIHILLFVIVFLIVLFGTTLSVYATYSRQEVEETTAQEHKYVKSILIQSGDTLWSIAERFADEEHYRNHFEYIEEIRQVNGLKTDKIQAGNYLMIVYFQ